MESSIFEPSVADILIRSRHTICDILEDRGYDPTPYRNIAPDQIITLAGGTSRGLDMMVKKRPDSAAPCERAFVLYILQDRLRQKLDSFLKETYDKDSVEGPTRADDVIVLLNEQYNEIFDKVSLSMWQTKKTRIVFFHIKQVVVHLGRHVLVPPHRKLTPEESKAEMERLHLTQKSQLPLIKHYDIQARLMGLVPGDIIEVLRPSPTSGEARILRLCAA
jgi:DNA-directed RNA polymerase subunit H (RpoH/RPB5)